MKWYGNLYTGSYAAGRLDEIREDIELEEFDFPGLYLITLASNHIDQLDIFAASRLIGRKAAARRMQMLVGVALGKEEAMDVLQTIARDTVSETGGCDMRSYLRRKQQVFEQEMLMG
ncbi:MAG: hypothetical protein IJ860_08275 [Eubacterium sp.]|nr:hypothetical protein [Eubacterium sp.]